MIEIKQTIRTKRKSIALIVERDGSLIVRAPLRTSDREIRKLVEKKADWIREKQALVKSVYPPPVERKYVNGEEFWYLGKPYKLQIVDDIKPAIHLNKRLMVNPAILSNAPHYFKEWYREQARRVITQRVDEYASRMGLKYRQVKITSAQTRWGSCSGKGTLCFTWRLVMAPLPVIDYVVVHELVHLRVRNHSRDFWSRVAAIVPDYKKKREWLNVHSEQMRL